MIEAITLKPFNNSSNQFSAKKKSVTYAEQLLEIFEKVA